MTLREKMKQGPVFGFACYTGAVCVVEAMGNWEYDFVYLDLEHCPIDGSNNIERLIMGAKLAGISPLVRVSCVDEVQIRKVLEMGAEGVIIPHVRTTDDVHTILQGSKFPPLGRRGGESCVRSAKFGGPEFSWNEYTRKANEDTLIILMDEDYEFTENLHDIMEIPGIDAVNFGPIDYALSIGAPVGYKTEDKRVADAFADLVKVAKGKGIHVMCPVVPSTKDDLEKAVAKGINMIILGNDMQHVQNAMSKIKKEAVDPIRNIN